MKSYKAIIVAATIALIVCILCFHISNNAVVPMERNGYKIEHSMNYDDVVYSLKVYEDYLGAQEGKLSIDEELKGRLIDNSSFKNETYRIMIRDFKYDNYNKYLNDEREKVLNKYSVFREVSNEKVREEIIRFARVSFLRVNIDAYNNYMKPILDQITNLGLSFEEKYIDLLTDDGEVYSTQLYIVAYADSSLIEQLSSFLIDKEYGFTIDLAPPFVDNESSSVYYNDPWFMN